MLIECKISAPQFKDGNVWRYHRQRGIFDTRTKIFEPTGMLSAINGDHIVHFKSKIDFLKSVIIKLS